MKIILLTAGFFIITSAMDGKKTSTVSYLGEPFGPLGPTIIEKPQNLTHDIKVIRSFTASETKIEGATLAEYIVNRTYTQRRKIGEAFVKAYDISVLDFMGGLAPLSTDFRAGEYDSTMRGKSTSGLYYALWNSVPQILAIVIDLSLNSDDWSYMSILCTSSATKLQAINEEYLLKYGNTSLADDIRYSSKDQDVNDLLIRMLDPRFSRPDNGTDMTKIEEQIALIPNKTVPCDRYLNWKLFDFMASASFEQIKLVATEYPKRSYNFGQSVVDRFRQHCKRNTNLVEAYKRIVRYAMDRYEYLAEDLRLGIEKNEYHSFSKILVILTRSEVDLKDVLAAYKKKYNEDLVAKAEEHHRPYSAQELYYAIIKANK